MSSMPASAGKHAPRLRSIGEVIAELRSEFGDLTPSKLRFLEAEGLVAPARLPNGYRKYTEAHIERLRVVLTLQRDQYLPLKVIKEKLVLHDAGEDVLGETPALTTVDVREDRGDAAEPIEEPGEAADAAGRIAQLAAAAFDRGPRPETLGREELLARSGLTRAALAEIEEARLVVPSASGRYDEDALIVATVAARLAERGVQVRHIKPTRHTVDRELGHLETLLATKRKRMLSGDSSDQHSLAEAQREIAGGLLALHAALLRSALRSSL
jgi:DNA-binding transcriptional MerR regulator